MAQNKAISEGAEPKIPADLQKALKATPKVAAMWKGLTSIGRRDFVSWIECAKQPDTRQRRIDTLGARMASGKRRPCCFAVVPMKFYKALGTNAQAKVFWKNLAPDERRDFIDWINAAKESGENKRRIEKACTLIAAGKKRP